MIIPSVVYYSVSCVLFYHLCITPSGEFNPLLPISIFETLSNFTQLQVTQLIEVVKQKIFSKLGILSPELLKCFIFPLFMHQSIPAAPIPPPGNCRAFACLVSPGGGALENLARPGGRAFAYPRAFDTRGFRLEIQTWRILSQRTSSSSQVGSSAKDWTNLWRFSRFYAFLHCSSRHNYHLI